MARVHSKNTVVTIDGDDISTYTKSSEVSRKADIHDNTTYGSDSHTKDGGLLDGSIKMDGVYDSTAVTGPRAVLVPLLGTTVTFIRRIEGTGSGLPQDSCSVVVGEYVETSPVADYVMWSITLEITGDVDTTAQS
jgi:hypothetical protein